MIACYLDVLADLERVAVIDLQSKNVNMVTKKKCVGRSEAIHLLGKASHLRRSSIDGHTWELLLEFLIATGMIAMQCLQRRA